MNLQTCGLLLQWIIFLELTNIFLPQNIIHKNFKLSEPNTLRNTKNVYKYKAKVEYNITIWRTAEGQRNYSTARFASSRFLWNVSTQWPKSNFAYSNGYNPENMHFWHHFGEAKMCFGHLSLFSLFRCFFAIFKIYLGIQKPI